MYLRPFCFFGGEGDSFGTSCASPFGQRLALCKMPSWHFVELADLTEASNPFIQLFTKKGLMYLRPFCFFGGELGVRNFVI